MLKKTTVKAEPSLLKTLLYNLIDNAIKFSYENSVIYLQAYRKA